MTKEHAKLPSMQRVTIKFYNGSKCRPPHKSVYWKTISFISHPKHMLWVLKRTVSMGTQNTCLNRWVRKYLQFTLIKFLYLDLCKCSKSLNTSCQYQQCRPRSDCFFGSSLIRVYPVCYSNKNFVDSSPDNQ